jgi:glycosyltransferase involved in cell wall biosynthesis
MLAHLPAKTWKKVLFWLGTRLSARGQVTFHSSVQLERLRPWVGSHWTATLAPYQVDTAFWAPTLPQASEPLVVAVGSENRDYGTLLSAARKAPSVRFVVAAGSHWARHTHAASDVAESVEFISEPLGFADLRDLYSRSAAVVVPLIDVDNQSGITTILEAMSMGKPVIVTASQGQRECVAGPLVLASGEFDYSATVGRGPQVLGLPASGHTGLYVPVGDAEALAAAVKRIATDSEFGLKLGMEGRRTVQSSFTIERFVENLAAAITSGERPATESAVAEAVT